MSVTRCACPNCHKTFSVPDDIVGKKVRCPGCQAALVAKVIAGKTTLALAGVSGMAKTQALPVKTKTTTPIAEEVEGAA